MNIMIPDNEERDYYQEETLFALKYRHLQITY